MKEKINYEWCHGLDLEDCGHGQMQGTILTVIWKNQEKLFEDSY
jgi:hypothetical protein